MVWFKVDDNLAFHRKTVGAGNAAMGLWVRAGSWCGQHLTDGFIPDHMIATLGTPAQKQKLIDAGFWIAVDGGCQFHSWNDKGRQPTSKTVIAERERNAERQAKHRGGRYRAEPPVAPAADFHNNLATTSISRNARTVAEISTDSDTLFSEYPQVDGTSNGVSSPLVTGVVTGAVTAPRPDPTSKNREKNSLAPLDDQLARFDEFYRAYPRRQDRRAAERAWKAALKRGATAETVIAAATAFARAQHDRERRFIKLPATWLNAGSYDDEPETAPLRVVGGYQAFRNPTDDSVYDEPLIAARPQEYR